MESGIAVRQERDVAPGIRLAGGTELLGEYKDSGFEEPKFLVARADGQVMQLPGLLYRVVGSLDGRTAEEIAASLNQELAGELDQSITAEDIREVVEEQLRPVGLIAPETGPDVAEAGGAEGGAGPSAMPRPAKADPLLALRYRAGVIPASVACRISGVLRPLFFRPVWLVLLACFLAVDAAIVVQGDLPGRFTAGFRSLTETPVLLLATIALIIADSAFHEWGHITACQYGGARPGDVGVGIYIVWPAFYSTVTDSYRLDRKGRLRTDLGGVYFESVFMAVAGLAYLYTGQPWLFLALVAMHVEMAWQFLPSIRLDGYYILADLIGVPDLFGYVKATLLSLVPGRPTHPKILELRPRARRVVIAWVSIVVPVIAGWTIAFAVAAPRLFPVMVRSIEQYVTQMSASARTGDVVGAALGVVRLGVALLPWVGVLLMLWALVATTGRRVAARAGLGVRLSAAVRTGVRRGCVGLALLAVGAAVALRVWRSAASLPVATIEARLADGALAGLRGLHGAPSSGPGELLARQQLLWWGRLTGAFDRHASVVLAGREFALVSSSVLVLCLLVLVARGLLRPIAAGIPLLAVLAMGPAVTVLGTLTPALVGAAWCAAGATLLATTRGRTAAATGAVALAVGIATAPSLAVPVAAASAVLFLRRGVLGRAPASGRHVSADATAEVDQARWLPALLVLPVGGLAGFLTQSGSLPLHSADRVVLLLTAGVAAVGTLGVRRLRPLAVAVLVALGMALLPWPASGQAVVLVLLSAVLAAAALLDHVVRRQPQERPHPLLRAAVAGPALVLVVVGGLFLPLVAAPSPHTALAGWIMGPASGGKPVSVPPVLWGDLVRDGVPPARLRVSGTPEASATTWTVLPATGDPLSATAAAFPDGGSALTVRLSPTGLAEQRARSAQERQAAAQQQAVPASPQTLGGLLASSPHLTATPDVVSAVAAGNVDSRALALLAVLVAQHRVQLGEFPTTAGAPGHPPAAVLITALDGRAATSSSVVAAVSAAVAGQQSTAGARITRTGAGTIVDWTGTTP